MGSVDNSCHQIQVGNKFASYAEFDRALKEYQSISGQVYTKNGKMQTLADASETVRKKAYPNCKYNYITLTCKFGDAKEESQATEKQTR